MRAQTPAAVILSLRRISDLCLSSTAKVEMPEGSQRFFVPQNDVEGVRAWSRKRHLAGQGAVSDFLLRASAALRFQWFFWLRSCRATHFALLLCLISAPLLARTVTLKPEALEAFAVLSESNQINGWAAYNYDYTRYGADTPGAGPGTSYLLRYSLGQIPKGQRITRAEWTIAHNVSSANVSVWRVLADWGLGACFQYRATYPEKLGWSVPGARGKSTDRATNPTATGQFVNGQLLTVNVTPDIEMWYHGAAPNRGWLITFDSFALLHSATHGGQRTKWQLTITYEPE